MMVYVFLIGYISSIIMAIIFGVLGVLRRGNIEKSSKMVCRMYYSVLVGLFFFLLMGGLFSGC